MSTKASFSEVPMGAPDPINILKGRCDLDPDPSKFDLGVGVLRDEQGKTYAFPVMQKAKKLLEKRQLDYDYRPTVGMESYRKHSARLMFGDGSKALKDGRIASVQTVAGTGACRIGAVFLNKHWPHTSREGTTGPFRNETPVYIGVPTWGNYNPLFKHAGLLNIRKYQHLDEEMNLNSPALLEALHSAPQRSIFVLQGVCHNPTGQDYSQEQWSHITDIMLEKGHFAYLDTAYQGLGHGLEEDAYPIQLMADKGVDMLVCQSFSKNMGLYSERVGALHVVCPSEGIAGNVLDQLRSFVRWEVSSSPAFGAQLVETVLGDAALEKEWQTELQTARERLKGLRKELYGLLTEKFATPSPRTGTAEGWRHLVEENGLFSYTGISDAQAERLIHEHHVYLPGTGRINVSGLNNANLERVARAFDAVIKP